MPDNLLEQLLCEMIIYFVRTMLSLWLLVTGMYGSMSSLQDRKVAVVGKAKSGKTCIVKRLMDQDVTESLNKHEMTIDESYFKFQRMPGLFT